MYMRNKKKLFIEQINSKNRTSITRLNRKTEGYNKSIDLLWLIII